MRSFKEQVEADIKNVFLNTSEFGETHTIEGTEVDVVMDNSHLTNMKNGQILGMVEADVLIFGKADELPSSIEPGNYWNVDEKEMIITASGTDMGMAEIALKQNRSA
jgi:hypothetical protein